MIEQGFKIVRKMRITHRYMEGDLYFSMAAPAVGEVEYRFDTWTKPPEDCGPLAVFGDLDHAKRYTQDAYNVDLTSGDNYTSLRLLPCEYEWDAGRGLWAKKFFDTGVPELIELRVLPRGTVLASRVRLVGDNPKFQEVNP